MSEEEAVRNLGEAIGYGRLMQLAEDLWREMDKGGGELTVGTCAAFLVRCTHPVRDKNGHCDVCCGAGRVTKWVANCTSFRSGERP